MYGINGYDEDLQKLLGFKFPQTENFQAQQPQIEQGLLGDVGTKQPNQHQTSNMAAQLAQTAQNINQTAANDVLAQRQASTQQAMQQALARQQQQQAQSGQILGTLLKMYLTGGADA